MSVVLFVLIAAAVVAIAVWDFRRRAAAREAVSRQRFEEMFRAQAAGGARADAPPAAATPPAAPVPANSPAAVRLAARERFLSQSEALVYYLLKTGLPDHEIFANVSLASVVGVPAGAHDRDQYLRRITPYQVDFVACDKTMRVVAAVDLDRPAAAEAAGTRQFKVECLKQAGIRIVRIDPAAPPRREQLRALLFGGQDAPRV